jgi:hypothetical protein
MFQKLTVVQDVRQALAVDVSLSMEPDEQELQREEFIEAF